MNNFQFNGPQGSNFIQGEIFPILYERKYIKRYIFQGALLTFRHFIIRLFGIIDTLLRMCSVIKVALATIIPLAYIHSLLIICTYRSFAQTSLPNFIDTTPRNFFLTILRCSEDCQRLSREFDGNRDSQFDYLCSYK